MNAPVDRPKPAAPTISGRPSPEGRLVAAPAIIQGYLDEGVLQSQALWAALSPTSDPSHELGTFRTSWRELVEIIANSSLREVPEVFEMPPVPTVRVRARVRHVGAAPFVFVDELSE